MALTALNQPPYGVAGINPVPPVIPPQTPAPTGEEVDTSSLQGPATLPDALKAALSPPPGEPGSTLAGPPAPPPEIKAASEASPQLNGVVGGLPQEALPPEERTPTPLPSPNPVSELTSSLAAPSDGVKPQLKVPMTKLQKLFTGIKLAGVVGGAMEAAGDPLHTPQGAEMFQRTEEAAQQRELERERIQAVEKPLAEAHALYFQQFNPTKLGVQASKNEGILENTGLKNFGSLQVAALKAGAPMMVDPELASIAGQPQLAGKFVSGPTLQNFIRTLSAKGVRVMDLGDEGLWSTDRFGNRIKQVTINSPFLERAATYAKSRAENTPFSPVFNDDGTLGTISEAQAIQQGIPKAIIPTAAARSRGEQASTIEIVGRGLVQQVQENAQELGPVMGRYNSLADWIGSPDPAYKGLKGALESWIALHPAAHGFRGLNAVKEFQKAFGSTFNTPESLIAGIEGSFGTMEGLQQTAKVTPGAFPQKKGGGKEKSPSPAPSPTTPKKSFFGGVPGATPIQTQQ